MTQAEFAALIGVSQSFVRSRDGRNEASADSCSQSVRDLKSLEWLTHGRGRIGAFENC